MVLERLDGALGVVRPVTVRRDKLAGYATLLKVGNEGLGSRVVGDLVGGD